MKEFEDYEVSYLEKHGPKPYEGVQTTLRTLAKRYSLYIVSNCQSGYIDAFLTNTKLWDVISDFACFGDNQLPKGENIRKIAEKNNLDLYYYVGDIQGDYDSAVAGGSRFIHAAYGFGTIQQSVPRIASIRELVEVLEDL